MHIVHRRPAVYMHEFVHQETLLSCFGCDSPVKAPSTPGRPWAEGQANIGGKNGTQFVALREILQSLTLKYPEVPG